MGRGWNWSWNFCVWYIKAYHEHTWFLTQVTFFKMNRRLITISVLIALVALPLVGSAAFELNVAPEPSRAGAVNFVALLGAAIDLIWIIFVGAVVVLLILTGILFLTTHGDPEKVKKARLALILCVIGIVVALLGYRMFATINCLIDPSACAAICVPNGGACTANADCCSSDCGGSICVQVGE